MAAVANRMGRPLEVTLVVILGVLEAIAGLVGGIALIVDRHDPSLISESGLTSSQLVGVGIAYLVIAGIVAVVVVGLARGSNLARWIVGVLSVLHIAGGVYALVELTGENRWSGLASVVVAACVLYLLFGSERSREYFTGA